MLLRQATSETTNNPSFAKKVICESMMDDSEYIVRTLTLMHTILISMDFPKSLLVANAKVKSHLQTEEEPEERPSKLSAIDRRHLAPGAEKI